MSVKLPPKKPLNSERRPREYLTISEINLLLSASKNLGRYGHRDYTMILIAFRHGLRVSELVSLRWNQIDLKQCLIHISRRKNGINVTHPLFAIEIKALRKLKTLNSENPYVFVTERNTTVDPSTFRKIVARAGRIANLGISVHPHMLRHSTGFKLANDGQDTRSIQLYLGHKNIQNTVIYTQLSSKRFEKFWSD